MPKRLAVIDVELQELAASYLAAVPDGSVLQLKRGEEPFAQISSRLASEPVFDVLDIFSHGEPGSLVMTGYTVDAGHLQSVDKELRHISASLSPTATVHLYGCRAGEGTAGQTLLEILSTTLACGVSAASRVVGGAGAQANWELDCVRGPVHHPAVALSSYSGTLNLITGTAGNDVLDGTDLDDTLQGSLGVDVVHGGLGLDVFQADLDLSMLAADGNGLRYLVDGVTLNTSSSFAAIQQQLQFLALGTLFSLGTGGATFSTTLDGVEQYQINLTGTANNDLLIAQGGTIYWGGAGIDTLYLNLSADIAGIHWENDPTQSQTVATISVSGIERLLIKTGAGTDLIANDQPGNNSGDYIETGAGNDTVRGGDGNDTILSGDGDDLVVAGRGNNTVALGAGNDTVVVDGVSIDQIDAGTGVDLLTGRIDYSANSGASTGPGMVYRFLTGGSIFNANSSFTSINAERALGPSTFTIADQSVLSANRTSAIGIESVVLDLIGSSRDDLLVQTGGHEYRGGGGTDALYADFWYISTDFTFVNSISQDILVDGVTYSGIERLLLQTGSGNDHIDNTAVIATSDYISTGAGNDTVDGGGGNDVIITDLGDDLVTTHGGNDNVNLGDGNDTVIASLGFDTLNGSTGTDLLQLDLDYSFVAQGPTSGLQYATGTSVGRLSAVSDFIAVQSSLSGTTAGFYIGVDLNAGTTAFGMEQIQTNIVGTINNDLVILLGGTHYDGGAGIDTFYADWSRAVAPVRWVNDPTKIQVVQGVSIAGMENLLVSGGSGNDLLDNSVSTLATADQLYGDAGNDTLNGGLGADTLTGGSGNDVYAVDYAGDSVVEAFNEGIDTVYSSVSFTLGVNVENLTLSGAAAISGTGNALANVLKGNAGANVLSGGLGDDTYVVSSGDSVVEGAGAGTDTVWSDVSYTLGANVENLTLSGVGAINGTGNELANLIKGNTAANVLSGGLGNDQYIVSTGDSVVEGVNQGVDTVASDVSFMLSANVENLTLIGTAAINGTGNELANILTGNAAANVLSGGLGNDTYVVGAGDSVIEAAGAGTDTEQSSASYTLDANVENLTLTGTGAINGTGNELNNVLRGNTGANVLSGGLGDDTYVVSAGDSVVEAAGQGVDTVWSDVSFTLGANVENLTLLGTAAINGTGNELNNVLRGNAGANVLSGGLGDDTYVVSTGDSVVEGAGAGVDTVWSDVSYTLGANVENLTLSGVVAINGTGNELANLIKGNTAANVLSGGLGIDVFIGGAGNDTFVFDTALNAASNVDTITDFTAGDHLQLAAGIFSALTAGGALQAGQFFSGAGLTGSTSAGQGAGIYYDTTTGSLYYDADGFGNAAATKFAVISGHPAVLPTDILVG